MRAKISSAAERALHEVAHGRCISEHADRIWGWNTPAGQLRAERRVQFVVEFGEINADAYCLEVGCGTGLFTEKLARTRARIDAIDISPDLLEKAYERQGCENVSFILGNVETGDNLRGPYDAVVGISVLHHFDLSLALPHLVRVLKPNGRFVFTEPNLRNPQIWLERNVRWLKSVLGVSPDETAFVREELATTLKSHGLVNVSITPFDWLHPWTPRPLMQLATAVGSCLERTPLIREISGSLLIVSRKPSS